MIQRSTDNSPDAGVHAGSITATGKDTNSFYAHKLILHSIWVHTYSIAKLKNVKKKIDRFPILPFSLSVLVSVSEWEDSPKEVTLPLGERRLARMVHIVESNERNKIKILLRLRPGSAIMKPSRPTRPFGGIL